MYSPPSFQCLLHITMPSDPMELVLPHVIFWNPLVQLPLLHSQIKCCPSDKCAGKLVLYEWSCGQSKCLQPRLLHYTYHTVLLVCAIYKCTENNHRIYSTDPRVLNKLGSSFSLPFFLLHRTGITRQFVDSVVSLAKEGLSIKAIARHVHEEHLADVICRLVQCY